jgi:carboxymethylenebutenolidase
MPRGPSSAVAKGKSMPVKSEWVKYGDQQGYFAFPDHAALPLPAVVVIQEVMGVEAHMEDVCRRIAAAGYAALAPDLYTVGGERPAAFSRERIGEAMAFMGRLPPAARFDPAAREAELAKLPEPERLRTKETFAKIFAAAAPGGLQAFMGHLRAAVRYLRSQRPETREQNVACVGFCMGGSLSALLACEEPELSGAAVFYGMTPEKAAQTLCPVIGFYGARDERVNAGIPGYVAAMKTAGKPFEYRIYEGAGHAFFNDTGPGYEVKAARDSFARLLGFLARSLSG